MEGGPARPSGDVRAGTPGGRSDAPLLVITPRRSWAPARPAELWAFRGVLARLAARDVTLRYRQTVLGALWVIVQPLLGAGILTFVFSRVASLPAPAGVPYFVFSLAGMVAWTAFSQSVTRASTSLVGNVALVDKVFFPRLLLPLSALLSTGVDVGVSLVLLLVLLPATGVGIGLPVLLLPAWLLLIGGLAMGVGLVSAALAVRYRDVGYVVPVALQLALFASPVAYSVASVPRGSRAVFLANPLCSLLEAVRWSTVGTPLPSGAALAYSSAAAAVVLAAGLAVFGRRERQFADVI